MVWYLAGFMYVSCQPGICSSPCRCPVPFPLSPLEFPWYWGRQLPADSQLAPPKAYVSLLHCLSIIPSASMLILQQGTERESWAFVLLPQPFPSVGWVAVDTHLRLPSTHAMILRCVPHGFSEGSRSTWAPVPTAGISSLVHPAWLFSPPSLTSYSSSLELPGSPPKAATGTKPWAQVAFKGN